MSDRKTLAASFALCACTWLALSTSARADPFAVGGGSSSSWTVWTGGRTAVNVDDIYLGGYFAALSNAGSNTNPAAPFYPSSYASASGSRTITSAPVSAALSTSNAVPSSALPSSAGSSNVPDAFLNFGNGSYAEAGTLTSGNIQSWFNSPSVAHVFGGTPDAQQQSAFVNAVLQDVARIYQMSGISLNLTLDPNAQAAHTLSVVSGASYAGNSGAIGITDIGGNGFSFIDKLNYASSVGELQQAVAHNIAHELMHAFGVATHHDTTGAYIDAATAQWSVLTNPNTVFSAAAVRDIQDDLDKVHTATASGVSVGAELLKLYGPLPHKPGCQCPLCQHGYELLAPQAQAVPEPTTVALWLAGALGLLACRRRVR